jgi:type II restriction enzyme
MIFTTANHSESTAIYKKLLEDLPTLSGGTQFKLGDIGLSIESKDGLGGLIEEWFGAWAIYNKFSIYNPKFEKGNSQNFPDYYVGEEKDGYLEIKTFNANASPAFDIANFESYCESLSKNPYRLFSDYLIFSYKLNGELLTIDKIWLKKIWQITCASKAYPLKIQDKRGVIYNIRPASFHSKGGKLQFPIFNRPAQFVNALYDTQMQYNGNKADSERFAESIQNHGLDLDNL